MIFSYWEGPCPAYIEECLRTMRDVLGDEFVLVTPENVGDYLPDGTLNPRCSILAQPALRADCLRAALLATHGGWWFDADTVAFSSPSSLEKLHPDAEAIYCTWTRPPRRVLNGYIYMRQGSPIAAAWLRAVNEALVGDVTKIAWCDLGEKLLTRMVDASPSAVEVPRRLFLPIDIDSSVGEFFMDSDPWAIVDPDTVCFGLNHSFFWFHHRREMEKAGAKRASSRLLIHRLLDGVSDEEPSVSVCMSTYDRSQLLERTLASIDRQRPGFRFEVVVVDDGSPDEGATRRVCEKFRCVRYVRIDREPGVRNPCTARNASYRAARGSIVVCQSDDVTHEGECLRAMVDRLSPGTFVLANVWGADDRGRRAAEYVGPGRRVPYFFLGALYRRDLYAVGGNDEEFSVGTGYEDAWFGECLINGRGLRPTWLTDAVGYHHWHPVRNTPEMDAPAKALYEKKMRRAKAGEIPWQSAAGPWPETDDRQAIFTGIYETGAWGGDESKSGVGSSMASTGRVREELPKLLSKHGIRRMVDLACGDWNWMSRTELPLERYVGVDIVPELTRANEEKYGSPSVSFLCLDAVEGPIPRTDCVMCRDVLVHLSPADLAAVVDQVHRSGSRYLLATTFPGHPTNSEIVTGTWSPYNLQAPPFHFPEPLELINEGCTESYPSFADKSLALWRVSDLPGRFARSLVVCVEYDDFLAVTLPLNLRHFSRTMVVTSPDDKRTQELAARLGCDVHVTDAFYRGGAEFNKGAAVEEGLDRLGREGWICVWDADVVMPDDLWFPGKRTDCLYTPRRRVLDDPRRFREVRRWSDLPSPTQDVEFDGYFQLFHAESQHLTSRPWYGTRWRHAGGGDSDFSARFPPDSKVRPPFEVLHLGTEGDNSHRIGKNWTGRATPRIDGLATNQAVREERERRVTELVKHRDVRGLEAEKVGDETAGMPLLPRLMQFFWTGRMSWLRWLTVATFRRFNPDWRIVVAEPESACLGRQWTTHERDDRDYGGPDYCERLDELKVERVRWRPPRDGLGPAQASDVYQWQSLHDNGGFYADMDILWLRPMDSLLESLRGADAAFCLESGMMAVGFFGARPGCPLFGDLLRNSLLHRGSVRSYQGYGTGSVYALAGKSRRGPPGVCAVESLRRKYRGRELRIVPDETVYPIDWRYIRSLWEATVHVPSTSVGIHWFGGDPLSHDRCAAMTPENFRDRDCTMSRCIAEVLR